ncbi:PROCN domain-containing protein, partial [Hamiltosporidium tvaerminnensis]
GVNNSTIKQYPNPTLTLKTCINNNTSYKLQGHNFLRSKNSLLTVRKLNLLIPNTPYTKNPSLSTYNSLPIQTINTLTHSYHKIVYPYLYNNILPNTNIPLEKIHPQLTHNTCNYNYNKDNYNCNNKDNYKDNKDNYNCNDKEFEQENKRIKYNNNTSSDKEIKYLQQHKRINRNNIKEEINRECINRECINRNNIKEEINRECINREEIKEEINSECINRECRNREEINRECINREEIKTRNPPNTSNTSNSTNTSNSLNTSNSSNTSNISNIPSETPLLKHLYTYTTNPLITPISLSLIKHTLKNKKGKKSNKKTIKQILKTKYFHTTTLDWLEVSLSTLQQSKKILTNILRIKNISYLCIDNNFNIKPTRTLTTKERKKSRLGSSFHLLREILKLLKHVTDLFTLYRSNTITWLTLTCNIYYVFSHVGTLTGIYRYKYKAMRQIRRCKYLNAIIKGMVGGSVLGGVSSSVVGGGDSSSVVGGGDSSSKQHPFNDSNSKQHPVNNNTNNYHPFNDSTNNYHPVNNTNNYNPVNTTPINYHPVNNNTNNYHPVNTTPINYNPVNTTPINYNPLNTTTPSLWSPLWRVWLAFLRGHTSLLSTYLSNLSLRMINGRKYNKKKITKQRIESNYDIILRNSIRDTVRRYVPPDVYTECVKSVLSYYSEGWRCYKSNIGFCLGLGVDSIVSNPSLTLNKCINNYDNSKCINNSITPINNPVIDTHLNNSITPINNPVIDTHLNNTITSLNNSITSSNNPLYSIINHFLSLKAINYYNSTVKTYKRILNNKKVDKTDIKKNKGKITRLYLKKEFNRQKMYLEKGPFITEEEGVKIYKLMYEYVRGVNNSRGVEGVSDTRGLEGVSDSRGVGGVSVSSSVLEGVNNSRGVEGVNNSRGVEGVNNSRGVEGVNNSSSVLEGVRCSKEEDVSNSSNKQQGVNISTNKQHLFTDPNTNTNTNTTTNTNTNIPFPTFNTDTDYKLLSLTLSYIKNNYPLNNKDQLFIQECINTPVNTLSLIKKSFLLKRTFTDIKIQLTDTLTPFYTIDSIDLITDTFLEYYLWYKGCYYIPVYYKPSDSEIMGVTVQRYSNTISSIVYGNNVSGSECGSGSGKEYINNLSKDNCINNLSKDNCINNLSTDKCINNLSRDKCINNECINNLSRDKCINNLSRDKSINSECINNLSRDKCINNLSRDKSINSECINNLS